MSETPREPDWWQASDGKWYPPPPSSRVPTAHDRDRKSRMSGCSTGILVVLGLAVVLGLGSCIVLIGALDDAVDDADEKQRAEDAEEWADVGDPSCELDSAGSMVAVMNVTNQSSERSNYTIEVTFEAADGSELEAASDSVSALEPGQSTTASAQSFTAPPDDGSFTCLVVDVDRTSDES
jgi:hypothetical protein